MCWNLLFSKTFKGRHSKHRSLRKIWILLGSTLFKSYCQKDELCMIELGPGLPFPLSTILLAISLAFQYSNLTKYSPFFSKCQINRFSLVKMLIGIARILSTFSFAKFEFKMSITQARIFWVDKLRDPIDIVVMAILHSWFLGKICGTHNSSLQKISSHYQHAT